MGRTRAWSARVVALLLVAALNVLVGPSLIGGPSTANAADPCAPGGNKIACENSKPGTSPEIWDSAYGSGADSIQGFSTDISVNVGQRVDFKIKTDASSYTIDIYRIGYYQGNGARKITSVTPSVNLPQNQPNCINDLTTETYDCGNWAVSASWNVPSTAVSGVYIAQLKRSNGDSSHITFVVRDDASTSDVVFQTSDPTWVAYNNYGGSNFYNGGVNGRSYKLSYNRPMNTRGGTGGRDFFFANEYPMVRFLERNGYDVSYMAGVDSDRRGNLIKNHDVFLSVGHDEYWSGAQRANVEAARDAGVNLQFLSGNDVYWRTRYEPSLDTSHTAYRTLVSYKETWDWMKSDPSPQWTGTWRDPRYAPTSQGAGLPENALTGTMYQANYSDLPVTVSTEEGRTRLWRNTSLASLAAGQTRALAPHTVGYESNEDIDNGQRPAGLVRLSTTIGPTPEYLRDYGNTVTPGTTTHNLTLYKAPSGALVFSAGSVQWSWGLDEVHDTPFDPEPADVRMQQAQVNLLADMGSQPSTLMAGLVTASKSTDTTGPSVSITSPAAGASVANGTQRTISGTATDAGGGRVAGVEVSTNGGDTWHPATGTSSWSYTYVQKGMGSVPLRVRATDDSANTGAVATRNAAVQCPCSIFGAEVPPTAATNDSGAVELGLRFTPTSDGYISGVRFYKGTGNGGTHQGSLWSTSGARLATGTFTNETATGWQTLQFTSAVPVSANQTYVASYTAPQGRYALGANAFYDAPKLAPPLTVAGGFGAAPAGVFGWSGQYPASSHQSSNYYVDVLFTNVDDSPLAATNQAPIAGSSSVPPSTTVRATLSKPIVAGSASLVLKDELGQTVPGTTSYDAATRTVTFTPTSPLAGFVQHTATVSATDALGQSVGAGKTWSFRTAKPASAPGVCPCSLYDDASQPSVLEESDQGPLTLGVRFSSTVDGTVSAVRFYKGPNNTGTHTGTLWSATGTQLATGTFTGETVSGWQTLVFGQPVAITKNTEYIAGYRAPAGRYSVTGGGFASMSRSPLVVASNSGAFTYGTGYPSASSSTSYMVDVVFERAPSPLAVVGQSPAPGATQVRRDSQVVLEVSSPLASGWGMSVSTSAGAVAGTASLSSDGTQVTFVPTSLLPAGTQVNVAVNGLRSTEGVTLANQSWSFQTRSGEPAPVQSLFSSQTPAVTATDDSSPVELGVEFTPTKSGQVTGIRFFKGAGNSGVHKGSVWSASGTKLAGLTFVGETASGWQTAMLSTPLQVSAGTPYVVSYFAPQGHYSISGGFFNNQWIAGDLRVAAGTNGRYFYGAGGGFPQYSWNSTNYFVDVLFEKDPSAVTVASRTPDVNATGVLADLTPTITFSDTIATSGWTMILKQGTTTEPGSASLSSDSTRLTFDPTSDLAASTTYTVEVSGVTSTDGLPLATQTWSFTTAAATVPVSRLLDGLTPASHIQDNDPIELGMSFVPSISGAVTGVRFWKGPGHTGTHTGSLWSASGTRLGTVTFTNETADGWQIAEFASAIPVSAGQTYVISYYSPSGDYSVIGGFFSQARTVGPLTAPAGSNGLYRYATGGSFPTGSYNSTNYFVDVLFRAS
ncbi:DUF4082 domain-containing protein [Nocardioides alpinus]|nr:DUF4082 domain-containing protein [Nocardioides alpinus]PKH37442.1 hypothetical protein CXG46_18500 [Nocardioides alpinus]